METEVKKIAQLIKKTYEALPKSNIDGEELVIFATGDFGGEYGYGSSDLQAWGINKEGKLFWAYASGCSCGCSAGIEEKTWKALPVKETGDNTDIVKAVELFNVSKEKFLSSISSYNYNSY